MEKEVKKKIEKKEDIAIKVENLSKTFRVPHEKNTSIKGAVLNMFRKKNYEKFEALKEVSFEVKKGEFFGIVGRNGSGKSTLLKILAGIYVPDSGTVKINGKLSPFLELGVGFNPELTGRENLFLGGAILGLTRKEVEDKYNKIVAFAELEEFIDMKLKNYSSGMQVRLAFSLAINAHAEILLMDEVLAVGDSNFQAKCLREFQRYKKEGKTVVLVSHDLNAIREYCDRAILLENGKIKAIGGGGQVVESYIFDGSSDSSSLSAYELINNNKNRVKIESLKISDKNGKQRDVFKCGEDIVVRVRFKKPDLEKINFAFGVYTVTENYIFGANTLADRADTNMQLREGFFEFILKHPCLNSGSYYLKISIATDSFSQGEILSFISHSKEFKIISDTYHEGIVKLDYEWA